MEQQMRATWYVLEDGTAVDPSEVFVNDAGRYAHANGLVAMRAPDCPRSRQVEAKETQPEKKTEDMKSAPKASPTKRPGYKTRGK
jgi:hypothetical protein